MTPGSISQDSNGEGVKPFLGIVNYCHRFVPNCVVMCKPLKDILPSAKPSNEAVEWSVVSAFTNVQSALKSAGVLDFPLPDAELWLCMDASDDVMSYSTSRSCPVQWEIFCSVRCHGTTGSRVRSSGVSCVPHWCWCKSQKLYGIH
jgi:hypothetical protein